MPLKFEPLTHLRQRDPEFTRTPSSTLFLVAVAGLVLGWGVGLTLGFLLWGN